MNQMTTFILIISGLCILFYVMGLGADVNPFLQILIEPQTMTLLTKWTTVSAFIAFAAGGLTLGLVYKNLELGVMTAVLPILVSNLFQFSVVVSSILTTSKVLTLLIFGPLVFLLGFTIVDYWRGRD